jgi:dolichyl-phosphate-mannose-protein mannosyltransferase
MRELTLTTVNARKWHIALPRSRSLLVLLFCLTAGVRLVSLAATFKGNDKVDAWEDVSIAKNLLNGKGYAIDNSWRTGMIYGNLVPDIEKKIGDLITEGSRPTTIKQPVFPFLVAAVFYLFGFGNFFALFVVHSILAGLTSITLFLSLYRQSKPIATVFAFGFAVYPPFVYQCATSPEATIVLLFLLSLFCYQAVRIQNKPTLIKFAILGALAGILVMTNPGTLIFTMAVICLVAFVACDQWSDRIKQVIASSILLCVVVAPWFIRNYLVFDRVVMRARTGHELLKTESEEGHSTFPEAILLELERQGRGLNEVEEGEMLVKAIKSRLPGNPVSWQLIRTNLLHFWWEPPRYRNDYSLRYMLGRRIPYYILLILSIPALISSLIHLARRPVAYMNSNLYDCMALLLIATETALYGYVGGWNIRYHFPTELAMLLFASQTAVVLFDRLRWSNIHEQDVSRSSANDRDYSPGP